MDAAMSAVPSDIYARHGMDAATAAAEGIRWIDSIRLENPSLYMAMISDPQQFAQLVKSWDLVRPMGSYTTYAVTRRWNWWMAARELIQNALDVTEEQYGRSGMHVDVFVDQLGLHVRNRGPRLPQSAWGFGGTTKQCWERGTFGEGLKMAAIYYASVRAPMYVFTWNEVYKAVVSPTGAVFIVIGTAAREFQGVDVVVTDPETISNSRMLADAIFTNIPQSEILGYGVWAVPNCDVPKPSYAIKTGDVLYVRDIYVNTMKNITGRPSALGYNLWWVDLDANRTNVASQTQLAREVVKTWTPDALKFLLSRMINPLIKPGYDNLYEIWPEYYESSLFVYESDLPEGAREAALQWLREYDIEAVAELGSNLEAEMYLSGVKSAIVVPSGLMALFPKEVQMQAIIVDKFMSSTMEAKVIPENLLTVKQRGALNAIRGYYQYLASRFHSNVPVVGLVPHGALGEGISGACQARLREVEIDEEVATKRSFSDLMAVAGHEFSHCLAEEATDVTAAFERNLTRTIGYTNEMYMYDEYARIFFSVAYRLGGGGSLESPNMERWWRNIVNDLFADIDRQLGRVRAPPDGIKVISATIHRELEPRLDGQGGAYTIEVFFNPHLAYEVYTRAYVMEAHDAYVDTDMPLDEWRATARERARKSLEGRRMDYEFYMVYVFDPAQDRYVLMADTIDQYNELFGRNV